MQKNFKTDFPVCTQYTYANTAGCGLLSESLMDWRQEHDIDYLIGGSLNKDKAGQLLQEVRNTISGVFQHNPSQTYLCSNFTSGFSRLVSLLPKRGKVLVTEGEYPSVVRAFTPLDGWETIQIPLGENSLDSLHQAIDKERPQVFAFSMVHYITGERIPESFLKQLKQSYPDMLLMADGTQFLGAAPFSMKESAVDIMGASGYKWLLGGFGNGFLMVRDSLAGDIKEYLKPVVPLATESFLKDKDRLQLMLEGGHLDTLNFGSLKFTLEYLGAQGWSTIWETMEELRTKATLEFEATGLWKIPGGRETHGSTIFSLPSKPKVIQALQERDVIFSERNGLLRLSFHCYNTPEEIERIGKIIRKTAG